MSSHALEAWRLAMIMLSLNERVSDALIDAHHESVEAGVDVELGGEGG